jgi:spermidine/putrescine transport system permease protein
MPRGSASYVAVVLLFLHLPLLILMAFSFNASRFSVEWTGFTLAWFRGSPSVPTS